jgi:cold shock protein
MDCPPRSAVAGHAGGKTDVHRTVGSFDSNKGCGFIRPDDGSRDVPVPASAVDQVGMEALQAGQKLSSVPRHDPNARTNAAGEPRAR